MANARYFYSTLAAAKALHRSVRTISRLAEKYDVHPLVFEGSWHKKHIWTRPQLDELCTHLKVKRT